MIVYLHRVNTMAMLEEAAFKKIGVEVDIRTHNGVAFLSHDPITIATDAMLASEALKFIEEHKIPTILDFKETGIVDMRIIEWLGK